MCQVRWYHDWTGWSCPPLDGTPENHPARFENHCSTACDCKIYAISVLSFIGSLCAPDKAALKAEAHALQCTTAGPYNAYLLTFLELALYVVLVLTWWVFTP